LIRHKYGLSNLTVKYLNSRLRQQGKIWYTGYYPINGQMDSTYNCSSTISEKSEVS
jgi:hypothetical protein